MAAVTGGNLGIHRGWTKGEDDWHNLPLTEDEFSGGMEGNLHKLDTVVHLSVKDFTNTPGTATVGFRYLTADAPTGAWADHPYEIAVCTVAEPAAWMFYHVKAGWLINVEDEGKIIIAGVGTINVNRYARHTNAPKTVPVVIDPDTPTKQLLIDVSGVTGAKTLTMPNKDLTPLHSGGDSMSGDLDMDSNVLLDSRNQSQSKVHVAGASSALGVINLANGNVYHVTLDGTWTPTFSNWPYHMVGETPTYDYGEVLVIVVQAIGGSETINWGGVVWPGASAPTMTPTANKVDIYKFRCLDSSTIYGEVVGQNY